MPWLGVTLGAISGASSLLGHPDDPARKAKADQLYQRAVNGDAQALRQLDCLSGSQTYAAEFNALAPPGCGFATESTRAYAKTKLLAAKAAIATGGAAATVTGGAATVGMTVAPGAYLQGVTGGVSPLVIGGALVAVYLLFFRGR